MPNAAQELITIFESWQMPTGHAPINARSIPPTTSQEPSLTPKEMWSNHARAVALLEEVGRELDLMKEQGDDVEAFRHFQNEWWEGIFSVDYPWRTGVTGPREVISGTAMLMLRSLGLLLSKVGRSASAGPTQRASLLDCLNGAQLLLEEELDDWDRNEKEYLYRLIASAREAVEQHNLHGELDLRARLNELIGSLTGIALDIRAGEGKDSGRFEKVMQVIGKAASVLRGIVYDSEAVTSLSVSAGVIMHELTDKA